MPVALEPASRTRSATEDGLLAIPVDVARADQALELFRLQFLAGELPLQLADELRPAINRDEGTTLAFAKAQARKMLDAPAEDSVAGLRDRALLSVGLQVGLRRAEINAALKVGDLHQNRGYDSLRVVRKGGRRDALAINPQTAARLRAYLDLAGHGADLDGPLFRPLRPNGKRQEEHRPMDPDAIDRVVRKFATALGLDRGYSAHSMRATFITTARSKTAPSSKMCKRPPVAAPSKINWLRSAFTLLREPLGRPPLGGWPSSNRP